MSAGERPIVVFDALCVLCSGGARFLIEHDRAGLFRLASVQSPAGAALCRRFGIDPDDPESMILVEGERMLRDSDAVIAIARRLGGPWRLAGALAAMPRPVRDAAYRWVARNRYRLLGRRETCWVPAEGDRERLL